MPRSSSLVTILALSSSTDLTHTFSTSLSFEGARYAKLLPFGESCTAETYKWNLSMNHVISELHACDWEGTLTSGEVFSGLPKRILRGTSSGSDA